VYFGLFLILLGLVFGLDVLNVGAGFIDEGPLAWVLLGLGVLITVGSRLTRRAHR
jgi:hypothetical protein